MKCEVCGVINEGNSQFCYACGHPLQQNVIQDVIQNPVSEANAETVIGPVTNAETVIDPVVNAETVDSEPIKVHQSVNEPEKIRQSKGIKASLIFGVLGIIVLLITATGLGFYAFSYLNPSSIQSHDSQASEVEQEDVDSQHVNLRQIYVTPEVIEDMDILMDRLLLESTDYLQAEDYHMGASQLAKLKGLIKDIQYQNINYERQRQDSPNTLLYIDTIQSKIQELIYTHLKPMMSSLYDFEDFESIVQLFEADVLERTDMWELMPLLAEAYVVTSDFERLNGLLRRANTPFTLEGQKSVLTLQNELYEKYPESKRSWSFTNEAEYDRVNHYDYGIATVGRFNVTTGSVLWDVIDIAGNPLTNEPYDEIGVFMESRASVSRNGKWGFINTSGEEVIPPIYDELKDPQDATFYAFAQRNPENIYTGFYNGFAAVRQGERWGFVDYNGNVLSPGIVFDGVQVFNEGYAVVRSGTKYGLLSVNGSYLIEPGQANNNGISYDVVRPLFEGIAAVNWSDGAYRGIIDQQGNLINAYSYTDLDLIQDFREGLATVRKKNSQGDNKWGYINRDGRIVIDVQYDEVTVFIDGIAKVGLQDAYGLINREGHHILPINYDDISSFSEGYAIVTQNGLQGLVNSNGEITIPVQYEVLTPVSHGILSFRKNGLWGVMTEMGEELVMPVFENMGSFNNGLAPAQYDSKWGIVDFSGHFVVEPIFDAVSDVQNGMTYVQYDDRYRYITVSDMPVGLNTQILNTNNQEVPYALVSVYNQRDDLILTTRANEMGVLKTVIPQGDYRLKVEQEGYQPTNLYATIEGFETHYLNTIHLVNEDEQDFAQTTIQLSNALTGDGVDQARVYFREGYNNLHGPYIRNTNGEIYWVDSDYRGQVVIDLPPGVYTGEALSNSFMPVYTDVVVSQNMQTASIRAIPVNAVLSDGTTRITLEWGDSPRDLDAHLIGPSISGYEMFHIYFPVTGTVIENAILDRDDTNGNGFETVTILEQNDGIYKYYVHDYTNGGNYNTNAMSLSGAKVRVYRGASAIATFEVPANRTGTYWEVFTLEGNQLTPLNIVSNRLDTGFYSYSQSANPNVISSDIPMVTTIEFSDINLEAAIRRVIKKMSSDITQEDLNDVNVMHLSGMHIQNLDGIEHIKHLEYLDLSFNPLLNIDRLLELEELKVLNLVGVAIDESMEAIVNRLMSNQVTVMQTVDVQAVASIEDQTQIFLSYSELEKTENTEQFTRTIEEIVSQTQTVTLNANSEGLIIDYDVLSLAADDIQNAMLFTKLLLQENDIPVNRTLRTKLNIQVATEALNATGEPLKVAFDPGVLQHMGIDSYEIQTSTISLQVDAESIRQNGEALFDIQMRQEPIQVLHQVSMIQDDAENLEGIMKLMRDLQIMSQDYVRMTVDQGDDHIRRIETKMIETQTMLYQVDSNGAVKLSLPASDSPYNCVFRQRGSETEAVGGTYNPETGKIQVTVNDSAGYYVINNKKSFSDIDHVSEAEKKAIMILASKELLPVSGNQFNGDETITREELIEALVKMTYLYNRDADCDFLDVQKRSYYFPFIASAYQQGIAQGYRDGTFRPKNMINRNEMIQLSSEALAHLKGYLYPNQTELYLEQYDNKEHIDSWILDALALGIREGLVIESSNPEYQGEDTITRLEGAMILYRLYEKLY